MTTTNSIDANFKNFTNSNISPVAMNKHNVTTHNTDVEKSNAAQIMLGATALAVTIALGIYLAKSGKLKGLFKKEKDIPTPQTPNKPPIAANSTPSVNSNSDELPKFISKKSGKTETFIDPQTNEILARRRNFTEKIVDSKTGQIIEKPKSVLVYYRKNADGTKSKYFVSGTDEKTFELVNSPIGAETTDCIKGITFNNDGTKTIVYYNFDSVKQKPVNDYLVSFSDRSNGVSDFKKLCEQQERPKKIHVTCDKTGKIIKISKKSKELFDESFYFCYKPGFKSPYESHFETTPKLYTQTFYNDKGDMIKQIETSIYTQNPPSASQKGNKNDFITSEDDLTSLNKASTLKAEHVFSTNGVTTTYTYPNGTSEKEIKTWDQWYNEHKTPEKLRKNNF